MNNTYIRIPYNFNKTPSILKVLKCLYNALHPVLADL